MSAGDLWTLVAGEWILAAVGIALVVTWRKRRNS